MLSLTPSGFPPYNLKVYIHTYLSYYLSFLGASWKHSAVAPKRQS